MEHLKIELTMEQMRYNVMHVMLEHQDEIKKEIELRLEQAFTSRNLEEIIVKEIDKQMSACIKKSIESFFSWGEGRKFIDEMVKLKLHDAIKIHEEKINEREEIIKEVKGE